MMGRLLLAVVLVVGTVETAAAQAVAAVRVASAAAHNGFVAEIDITGLSACATPSTCYAFGMGANNDPSTAKIVFTVTSPGYTTAGATTTYQRTVYGTQWVRKASPNQTQADETDSGGTLTVRVALSDFIYVSDTATVDIGAAFFTEEAVDGGTANSSATGVSVTNNSTLAYPKVVGRWAWAPHEVVTGDFLLEFVAFHRSAKDGKPVAAVKFDCVDSGATTNSATATAMTVSSRDGVGSAATNKVLTYAVTMSTAGWVDNSLITCNATAYPWIGNAGAVLDSRTTADGFADDERLGPFKLIFDNDADYGYGFAVVDATNGQASTAATWVYSSQSTAETNYASATTNSYNTIWRALSACDAFIGAAGVGRTDPGGCTILISGVGTIAWPGASPSSTNLGAQNTWATITRLSTVARASAVITADGINDPETQKVKFYDVTLFSASGSVRISGDDQTVDQLWVDNSTINLTTAGASPFVFWKVAYGTRNTVTAITNGFQGAGGSVRGPWALFRGNAGVAGGGAGVAITHPVVTQYTFLGNFNLQPRIQATGNASGHQISDNTIVAFNSAYSSASPWHQNSGSATIYTHGSAYVQNVVECLDNSNWTLEPTENTAGSNHIILWHNTLTGARMGFGYNDTGSSVVLHTNASLRFNLIAEYANKDDTWTTANGARTGAWPVGYALGFVGNVMVESANTEELRGEFFGLHTVSSESAGWTFVDNASANEVESASGDDSGNGNYHLTSGHSGYALNPGGVFAALPYDLEGTARRTATSGGSSGAFEMNSPAAGTGEGQQQLLLGVGAGGK